LSGLRVPMSHLRFHRNSLLFEQEVDAWAGASAAD
jgi:hypothetical protein